MIDLDLDEKMATISAPKNRDTPSEPGSR